MENNYRNKKTKLESKFEELLATLNVNFKYQHQVSSCIFDYLILDKNTVIEVDGDFHHCNPNSTHRITKYPIQFKSIGNDIRKNLIAKDNNMKLLRYWESDINQRPEWVIEELKRELNL